MSWVTLTIQNKVSVYPKLTLTWYRKYGQCPSYTS